MDKHELTELLNHVADGSIIRADAENTARMMRRSS